MPFRGAQIFGARMTVVFCIGALCLTYPLLSLFNRLAYVFGIPLLYLYLFLVWALLILLILGITAAYAKSGKRKTMR